MCKIREIKKRDTTERLYQRLQGREDKLPVFLYDDPRYTPTAVMYEKDGIPCGLCFGVMQKGDMNFYLHYLRITRAVSDKKDMIHFLDELFRFIRRQRGAEKIIMLTDQADDTVPACAEMLSDLNSGVLEKILFLRQVGVNTKDFPHFKQFHWYCPDLMERKGFEAVLIKDSPKQWQERLREQEEAKELPEDYLSPGLWEDNWEYDTDSSYILVRKGEDAPLGWIVTERVAEDVVKIRRFYIYKEARRLRLGPSFSTWVLDRIAERFRQLQFEVEKGNRQMEMFTTCYCRPILAFNYFKCNLTIKLKG